MTPDPGLAGVQGDRGSCPALRSPVSEEGQQQAWLEEASAQLLSLLSKNAPQNQRSEPASKTIKQTERVHFLYEHDAQASP